MRKIEEFIEREKAAYGGIYADIAYAQEELEPFLDENVLKRRKYASRLPVLRRYMELLDSAKAGIAKDGLLGFLKDHKNIELLEDYKARHKEDLEQLEKCRACKCLKCPKECEFDSCLGCRDGARVVECDRTGMNTVFYDDYIIPLHNDSTGETDDYRVLATMQSLPRGKRYILLEGITNGEKYVLYYYPGISETTYGEITDPEEFDSVVAAYQSIERD